MKKEDLTPEEFKVVQAIGLSTLSSERGTLLIEEAIEVFEICKKHFHAQFQPSEEVKINMPNEKEIAAKAKANVSNILHQATYILAYNHALADIQERTHSRPNGMREALLFAMEYKDLWSADQFGAITPKSEIFYVKQILKKMELMFQAALASEGKEESKWISVEKDLPKIGEWYIGYVYLTIGKRYVQWMVFLDSIIEDSPYWLIQSGDLPESCNVTHWMPLPESPNN